MPNLLTVRTVRSGDHETQPNDITHRRGNGTARGRHAAGEHGCGGSPAGPHPEHGRRRRQEPLRPHRSAEPPGPAGHDVGGLPSCAGNRLGRSRNTAHAAEAQDRGARGRLPRSAVRHHSAQAQRRLRQSADRSGARDDVAKFYADFWNKPSALNHGHTVNEYWMEQTNGRIGIEFVPFAPYRAPPALVRVRAQRHRAGTGRLPLGPHVRRHGRGGRRPDVEERRRRGERQEVRPCGPGLRGL